MMFDLPPDPPKFWLPAKPAIIRAATPDLLMPRKEPLVRRRRGSGTTVAATPSYQLAHTANATVTNQTSFSITSVSLGTAASSRVLILAIGARGALGVSRTLSSASIGSDNFTIDILGDSNPNHSSIARLAYPTGTTATINITMSGAINRYGISLYALYDLRGDTPVTDKAGGSANSASVSVNVEADGIGIFAACSANTGGMSWTGPTEDYDVSAATQHRFSSASLQPSSAQLPLTGSVSFGGTPNAFTAVAVAYR